jgi:hypothetical protein
MPEEKKTIEIFGHPTEVAEVPIVSAVEPFALYQLEDGSTLRVKAVATSILRINDQFTTDGKPIYLVLLSPNTLVESSIITQASKTTTESGI